MPSHSIDAPAPHPLKPLVSSILLALACIGGHAQAQSTAQDEDTPASKPANVTELDIIEVTGQYETRDEAGRDDVFLKDVSNVYLGKEEIERYKGTSVGDLFKGLNGVYSGDSRNSGAVDPNIRGLQGGGRIPLTIDGTEQSTSVWMGPAGVANRNYLDPNLVGSIMVEKGPSMTRGVRTGIGGSVQVKTLEVDDIVRPGETFGFELKTETATNSVKPDESSFGYFGKDYRDIHGAYTYSFGGVMLPAGSDGNITPRKGASGKDLDFNDNAYRIAIANKQENIDLLGAYSYRKRGNYFSGKGGSHRYATDSWYDELTGNTSSAAVGSLPSNYVANYFLPGQEVTNTSSELESILLKATIRLPGKQTINLGYMRTDHTYGESIPWLVSWLIRDRGADADGNEKNIQGQLPYSHLKQNTYNFNYALKPDGNRWIDLQAGVWMTQSDGARHQNGDSVFGVGLGTQIGFQDRDWDDYVKCHVRGEGIPNPSVYCAGVPKTPPDKKTNPDGRYNIMPRALQFSNHNRWGVNLSNKFRLHAKLDLTVSADFTREKLKQWEMSDKLGTQMHEFTTGVNYLGPRAGAREEYNLGFNLNWAATPWLQLSAGYRYTDYWAHDDRVASQRAKRVPGWQAQQEPVAIAFQYKELMSDADVQKLYDGFPDDYYEEMDALSDDPVDLAEFMDRYPTVDDYVHDMKSALYYYPDPFSKNEVLMPYTGTHKGFRANNPFLNGTLDPNEMVDTIQSPSGRAKKYNIDGIRDVLGPSPANPWQQPEKKRGHAWMPQFGVTLFPTENTRIYVRYAEFARFANLFEATQSARSRKGGELATAATSPERAYNWEVGYTHDLSPYLSGLRYADFRINYFHSVIKDYIDRDYRFNIVQFDKKKMSGIEMQTRIDSGKYFASLGANYLIEQKMCDEDYASYISPIENHVPACVDGGFPTTFARTSLQPKYSINLGVGARLFEQKLEIGSRMTYHAAYESKSERKMGNLSLFAYNRPFFWNPIWVFDAYATYRVHDKLSIDLGINNITNRYYVDPLARVSQPAPGRTVKVGLTARF